MRLRLGKDTIADFNAAQPEKTNLLKYKLSSKKKIDVSNQHIYISSITHNITLSDISDDSKNYLYKAVITNAFLLIK